MSVLAIDIGNSRVGLGVFTQGKSVDPAQRFAHMDLDRELAPALKTLWETAQGETRDHEDANAETGIVIASVVPALTARIQEAIKQTLNMSSRRIGHAPGEIHVPIKTKLRDETTVGQDRLLAALAAFINTEKATVIVHCGTALVIDCVDDEGIFRGGAIAPGLQLAAKALNEHTAQLPTVSLTPPDDAEPFGRYTQEAINLGLYVGARGAIRELIERYATALGNWPHVVATGGDAHALLGGPQSSIAADLVDSFIPDLVLQGAALAWEHDLIEQ